MAVTPGSIYADHHFRAPPPSPMASGRNPDITHDLQSALRVPKLVLPDRVFSRKKLLQDPPELDFRHLESMGPETAFEILDSAAKVGCFQVTNHGIPGELIRSVLAAGGGIFSIPPEVKVKAARSPEIPWGFEEVHAEEEGERQGSEEFVWCHDDADFSMQMQRFWPLGYLDFRDKMGKLLGDVGDISGKIIELLEKNINRRRPCHEENNHDDEEAGSSNICYVHKQWPNTDQNSSYDYDVFRILIRGCEFPHALSLHFTNGSSTFNVYSKKCWLSFQPRENAIIFTVGDRLQAWSGGRYNHVIGRAVFQEQKDCGISMAILYSPPKVKVEKEITISFVQQIVIAILLMCIYQIFVFMVKKI
ncbi:unnamed protein product [Cuscuta epithymum]|uniref:feruloyl-CoA 6-hydroxylase n=2 Tax=Cuscuta epithymum TaxID=186058 RepID=A0AAV0F9R9_9ASTE|nr:unnamed protein product [Cuscuta epithymum]